MAIDFSGRITGPIEWSSLPEDQELRDYHEHAIPYAPERHELTITLGSLDEVQALMDFAQDAKLSQKAYFAHACAGERSSEAGDHALCFVLMDKLANDLIAIRDAAYAARGWQVE